MNQNEDIPEGTWTCPRGHGGNDNRDDEVCRTCGAT
jgi:hypothetical protein